MLELVLLASSCRCVMQVDFEPHGECHINIVDDIIVIEAKGPWNIEFIRELHRRLANVASQFEENNTYLLIRLIGQALAGEKEIDEHIKFIGRRRATAVALDLSECQTAQISKEIFTRIYMVTEQKHQCFTDKSDAIAWLKLIKSGKSQP